MDKVRAFMKAAWIQRFWILSVVGTLAAVVCWMMASGELQRQFAANKTAIDAKFGNMKAISGKDVHGNPAVNAKEREEAKKIADSVKKLWQSLFDAQREVVLKWPDVLGADFVSYVENAKFDSNHQAVVPRSISELHQESLRRSGRDRRRQEDGWSTAPPPSAAASDAKGVGGGEGGMGPTSCSGPDGLPIEEDYLVQWVDQAKLRQKLEFTGVPTSRQMWVTQEDLWVYETLLHAIADTNKERGATRPDNTAIRVIQSLEVGAPAAMAMAQESVILMPADAMAAAGGEVPAAEMRPGSEMGRRRRRRRRNAPAKPLYRRRREANRRRRDWYGDGVPSLADSYGADDGRALFAEGAWSNAPTPRCRSRCNACGSIARSRASTKMGRRLKWPRAPVAAAAVAKWDVAEACPAGTAGAAAAKWVAAAAGCRWAVAAATEGGGMGMTLNRRRHREPRDR